MDPQQKISRSAKKKRLKACLLWKVHIKGLKTPTGRRQSVGCSQAWPRISTRNDREQIQESGQSGLEPGTTTLRVRGADHSATPLLKKEKMLVNQQGRNSYQRTFQILNWRL